MGFWFKSRYRYILLLLLSCIVLTSLVQVRLVFHILAALLAATLTYLASAPITALLLNLYSFKLSVYMFNSWALHYIFIYLTVILLIQLALKRQLN